MPKSLETDSGNTRQPLFVGDAKAGMFEIKHSDEAVRGALVTQAGAYTRPPFGST